MHFINELQSQILLSQKSFHYVAYNHKHIARNNLPVLMNTNPQMGNTLKTTCCVSSGTPTIMSLPT